MGYPFELKAIRKCIIGLRFQIFLKIFSYYYLILTGILVHFDWSQRQKKPSPGFRQAEFGNIAGGPSYHIVMVIKELLWYKMIG